MVSWLSHNHCYLVTGLQEVWFVRLLPSQSEDGLLFYVQEWGKCLHDEVAICLQASISGESIKIFYFKAYIWLTCHTYGTCKDAMGGPLYVPLFHSILTTDGAQGTAPHISITRPEISSDAHIYHLDWKYILIGWFLFLGGPTYEKPTWILGHQLGCVGFHARGLGTWLWVFFIYMGRCTLVGSCCMDPR